MTVSIQVENVGKRYRIGLAEELHDTLGGAVIDFFKTPVKNFRKLRRLARFGSQEQDDIFWALRNVDLSLNRGEVVGVIGPNGAGKSTLLKILSRITVPTEGRIALNGRVASLLEVGTGFHGELSGRENVYLNGTILGMRKKEIDRKFDQIVEFSGVGKFIDTPIKRYSSGMSVRLAFSVAAYLEPEILLVDEVLAVGDAEFQQKCLGKMEDVASHGRTVMFVSHNMTAIQTLCPRTVWIQEGRVRADGDTHKVVEDYLSEASSRLNIGRTDLADDLPALLVKEVVLKNSRGDQAASFEYGDDIIIEIHYSAKEPVEKPYLWVDISGRGAIFGANMFFDDARPDELRGQGVISCRFKDVRLLPDNYTVNLGIKEQKGRTYLVQPSPVISFRMLGTAPGMGMPGKNAHNFFKKFSPIVRSYEWIMPDGKTIAPDWCQADYEPPCQRDKNIEI